MNIESSDIVKRLAIIFQDTFTQADYNFSVETNREDIGEWDSLNHIRLLTAIESEFGFQFDLDEIEELSDVSTIASIITKRLS